MNLADRYGLHRPLAGTFVKVVRSSETWNPDSYRVLYLRPNGTFLFLGYWPNYEWTVAGGLFTHKDMEVTLQGKGVLRGDFNREGEQRALERTFRLEEVAHTPTLFAEVELPGWSLLSWRGAYTYIGLNTIFNPDGKWLPDSLESVDEKIRQTLGTDYPVLGG